MEASGVNREEPEEEQIIRQLRSYFLWRRESRRGLSQEEQISLQSQYEWEAPRQIERNNLVSSSSLTALFSQFQVGRQLKLNIY